MSSKGFVNMAKSGKVAATARRRQPPPPARPPKGGGARPPLPGKKTPGAADRTGDREGGAG